MDNFWSGENEYQELAREYYNNIEYVTPEYVTSRRMCPCLEYTSRCSFPLEGKAEYIEYRGPPTQKL